MASNDRADGLFSKQWEMLMQDDDRNFGEQPEATGENSAEPIALEEMADHFPLLGKTRRASLLEELDRELRGEIGSGSHHLRRQVRLMELRRQMGDVHEALRKARR